MQKVVMYGKGAVQILHGKETLKAVDGMISVPPELVGRMEALGYSTAPRGGDEEAEEPIAKLDAPVDTGIAGATSLDGVKPSDRIFTQEELVKGPDDFPYTTKEDMPAFFAQGGQTAFNEVPHTEFDDSPESGHVPIVGSEVERQKRLEALLAEGLTEEEARQIIDAEAAPLPPLE